MNPFLQLLSLIMNGYDPYQLFGMPQGFGQMPQQSLFAQQQGGGWPFGSSSRPQYPQMGRGPWNTWTPKPTGYNGLFGPNTNPYSGVNLPNPNPDIQDPNTPIFQVPWNVGSYPQPVNPYGFTPTTDPWSNPPQGGVPVIPLNQTNRPLPASTTMPFNNTIQLPVYAWGIPQAQQGMQPSRNTPNYSSTAAPATTPSRGASLIPRR